MPFYTSPEEADSPLLQLLLTAAPPNEQGQKTIKSLAKHMPISRHSIHKWVRKAKLPGSRVLRIVEIGEGRVKQSDFDPFVYKI